MHWVSFLVLQGISLDWKTFLAEEYTYYPWFKLYLLNIAQMKRIESMGGSYFLQYSLWYS